MTSRLEKQINVWNARKEKPKKRAILEILEAVLNNADIAIRQRKQEIARVTIAADLDENFLGRPITWANAAYAEAARVMRNLGCTVSRDLQVHSLAQMKFHVIRAVLGLKGANLKKIQRKLSEVRAQLKKGKFKKKKKRRRRAK